MADLAAAGTEVRWTSSALEVVPFSGDGGGKFLARTESETQFVIPELAARLLQLLDGDRTTADIAAILSRQLGHPVTVQQVERLIAAELAPRQLVRDFATPAAAPPARSRWEFALRVPLFSSAQLAPVADRLNGLFHARTVVAGLALSALAHFVFYSQPPALRKVASVDTYIALAYVFMFLAVLFHELGHLTACRRFRCEHGELGFCVYLIFPAMYVNLSRVWRLPSRQRAVIDVGGIYFQQLLIAPLVAAHLLLGDSARGIPASLIYALDIMSAFSLNPFIKCDGYWIVSDLSGIANLQKRVFRWLKSWWPGNRAPGEPSPIHDLTRAQRIVLGAYASVFLLGLLTVVPRIIVVVPSALQTVMREAAALTSGQAGGVFSMLTHVKKILVASLVISFAVRTGRSLHTHMRESWIRHMPVKAVSLAALTCVFALALSVFVGILVHESGHALTAIRLQGVVPLLQVHLAGGRTIVYFPEDSEPWRTGAMLAAGCLATMLCGLLAAAWLRSREAVFALVPLTGCAFAGVCGVMTMVSSAPFPRVASELRSGLRQSGVGIPGEFGFAAAVFLAGALILVAAGRWLRRLLSGYGASVRITAGVPPMLAMLCVYALGSAAVGGRHILPSRSLWFLGLLCLIGIAVAVWKGATASREPDVRAITRLARPGAAAGFALVCLGLLQWTLFGLDRAQPKGLFFSANVQETSVRSCNIRVRLTSPTTARVSLAMRPFASQHDFLWQRVRDREPSGWEVYDRFTLRHVPELLPVRSCRIVSRSADSTGPFRVDGQSVRGARVVEADVDLAPLPRDAAGNYHLALTDFWLLRSIGQLDDVVLEAPQGFSVASANTITRAPRQWNIKWDRTSQRTVAPIADIAIRYDNTGNLR